MKKISSQEVKIMLFLCPLLLCGFWTALCSYEAQLARVPFDFDFVMKHTPSLISNAEAR